MPPVLKPNPINRAAGTTPAKTTDKKAVTKNQGERSPEKDKAPVTKTTLNEGDTRGG